MNNFEKSFEVHQNKEEENSETSIDRFIDNINSSGVVERLAGLTDTFEEREKQGLGDSARVEASEIERVTKKLKEAIANRESSWEDMEAAFSSLGFLLGFMYNPGHRFNSLETSDTLNTLVDHLDGLGESFKSFKDSMGSSEKDTTRVKLEIDRCFMFLESASKELKETASLPYFSLSVPELRKKTDDLEDRHYGIRRQNERLQEGLMGDLTSFSEPFDITKDEFIGDDSKKGFLNPDDLIEIKIEKSSENEEREESKMYPYYRILVRSKQTTKETPRSVFEGTITEGNPEELSNFISHMKGMSGTERYTGYKGDAETMLHMMKSGTADNYKLIVAKNEKGDVVGIATVNVHQKNASLATLVIHVEHQNKGAGSAILAYIKSKYDSITLVPIAKTQDPDLPLEYFQEKLEKFYKENGFVGAKEWNRDTASMDDKTETGIWHEIDKPSDYKAFGLNNEYLSTNEVIARLFLAIINNKKMRDNVSPEIVSKIEEWKKIYAEKEMISKERGLVNEARSLKK